MNNLLEKKIPSMHGSAQNKSTSSGDSETLPNSMMEDIARGTLAPTSAMLGHRENLSPSLHAKMQGAFGADFSNLEVYRSETARDAGVLGVASGNKVALSPDIDLNSHSGQAVLGHELSHVVAQAKGIGTQGRGIMETPSLERQAMIEGERAASGIRAFSGNGLSFDSAPAFSDGMSSMGNETLTPISSTTGAFGMGAPIQGKFLKPDTPKEKILNKLRSDNSMERLAGQDEYYQDDSVNMMLGSTYVSHDREVNDAFNAADDMAMSLTGEDKEQYNNKIAEMFVSRGEALADKRAANLAATGGDEQKADKSALLTPEATAFRSITSLQQSSLDASLLAAIFDRIADNPELTAKITIARNLLANDSLKRGANNSVMFESKEQMKYWTQSLNKAAKRSLKKEKALPKEVYNPEDAVQWQDPEKESGGRRGPEESPHAVWQRLRAFKRNESIGNAVTSRLAPDAKMVPGTNRLSRESFDRKFESSTGANELNLARLVSTLGSNVGQHVPNKEAADIVEDLAAGKHGDPSGDARVERGMRGYKKLLHNQLLRMQERYGIMLTQMHPDDVFNFIDIQQFGADIDLAQDMLQIDDKRNLTGINVVDPNDPQDQEFIRLREYYHNAISALAAYGMGSANTQSQAMGNESQDDTDFVFSAYKVFRRDANNSAGGISGPHMNDEQLAAYKTRSQKRLRDKGHSDAFVKRFWE